MRLSLAPEPVHGEGTWVVSSFKRTSWQLAGSFGEGLTRPRMRPSLAPEPVHGRGTWVVRRFLRSVQWAAAGMAVRAPCFAPVLALHPPPLRGLDAGAWPGSKAVRTWVVPLSALRVRRLFTPSLRWSPFTAKAPGCTSFARRPVWPIHTPSPPARGAPSAAGVFGPGLNARRWGPAHWSPALALACRLK